jgi:phage gp46-like protein
MTQQGDVLLEQTNDDGEITVENGLVQMTGKFETAAYLSLFGGNEDDDGRPDNEKTFWGNLSEINPSFKLVSETQHLLQSIPATSSNLKRIEDAVKRDLQWFLNEKIASSVDVTVTIPALNRIKIVININAIGKESQFEFVENWRSNT